MNGVQRSTAANDGAFRVTRSAFASTACTVTVGTGRTSTTATLDPRSPSGSGGTRANVPTPSHRPPDAHTLRFPYSTHRR
jgi:hypothetical protein